MVFHEITREAIARGDRELARPRHEAGRGAGGPAHPRPPRRLRGVDRRVGAASAAARRPVGCRASPTRLVVERERARMAFRSGRVLGPRRHVRRARHQTFPAHARRARRQAPRAGPRLRRRRPARSPPAPTSRSSTKPTRGRARRPARATRRSRSRRSSRSRSPNARSAPFITSTLQQEAGRKLGFSAGRTMAVAQGLYERGLHHLHAHRPHEPVGAGGQRGPRPDPSSSTATTTCPPQPRAYRSKVKNAQEAHEAIRPAGDRMRTADDVARRAAHSDERASTS